MPTNLNLIHSQNLTNNEEKISPQIQRYPLKVNKFITWVLYLWPVKCSSKISSTAARALATWNFGFGSNWYVLKYNIGGRLNSKPSWKKKKRYLVFFKDTGWLTLFNELFPIVFGDIVLEPGMRLDHDTAIRLVINTMNQHSSEIGPNSRNYFYHYITILCPVLKSMAVVIDCQNMG